MKIYFISGLICSSVLRRKRKNVQLSTSQWSIFTQEMKQSLEHIWSYCPFRLRIITINKKKPSPRRGIEPRSPAWQAGYSPLYYRGFHTRPLYSGVRDLLNNKPKTVVKLIVFVQRRVRTCMDLQWVELRFYFMYPLKKCISIKYTIIKIHEVHTQNWRGTALMNVLIICEQKNDLKLQQLKHN